jgi:WD40 repeat protein
MKITESIFATSSEDKTVKIWNVHNMKMLHDLKGHTGFVLDLTTTFLENKIVSVGYDKRIIIWQ